MIRSGRILGLALASALVVAGVVASRDGAFAAGGSLLRALTTPDPQPSAYFGDAVAAGDVNDDGRAEVVVGAWGETVDGHANGGRAYVFSARDGSLLRTLAAPDAQDDAQFGHAVATADVNGDGNADVIVGAPDETLDGQPFGRVYVFSGKDGALLRTLSSPNPLGGGEFGDAVAAGDVDGDGVPDVIVGASDESVGHVYNIGQGRVYVFSGEDGSLLSALDTPNAQLNAHFGDAVAAADVNGDGKDDVIAGAAFEDVGDNTAQGRAYVFSGAEGTLLFTLTTPNAEAGAQFGWSVAAADLNQDGRPDVIAGSWGETVGGSRQGRVHVFSGADGSLLRTMADPDDRPGALFGWSVAAADLNHDRVADVVVGAIGETVAGNAFEGRAYAFSGADGSLLYTLSTAAPQADAAFGAALAVADVQGDGAAEVIVGASGESVGASDLQGRAYVFSGVPISVGGIARPPDASARPSPAAALRDRVIAVAVALAAVSAGVATAVWRRRRARPGC